MGVQGLWKLVEPCGRMVPLEKLSNKVLAVGILLYPLTFNVGLQLFRNVDRRKLIFGVLDIAFT